MPYKILITTSSFAKNDLNLLKSITEQGLQFVLNPFSRKLTETEVFELIEQHQPVGMIAGVEPLTRKVLEKAQVLKVISRAGIGIDSVDLYAVKDLGITITNTPDAPTIPVAELTLGMILTLLRSIHISDTSIRHYNSWVRPMGNLLHGRTVGLIGCGRIGSYLSKLLSSFGCEILGFDPLIDKNDNFSIVSLEKILSNADILSLHIPYNQKNHHFINTERIKNMKKGSLLINTARGGLIDEDALYDALSSGYLGGAAIDCFEQEPYTGKLKKLDNVLLTAHIGSYAQEGRILMEKQAVENLLRELRKAGCIK
ncbi:MAG: phosphoglycerate dehydrogenase [Desulfobacterales bacterium]|nr:phosphoglycerate dehydrogenase [Desulfobacterales bacterium]